MDFFPHSKFGFVWNTVSVQAWWRFGKHLTLLDFKKKF